LEQRDVHAATKILGMQIYYWANEWMNK
jgi:hypothetical protein